MALRTYLSQALPQTCATCAEWWAQEAMVLIAGFLPDPQTKIAAHGILFNLAVVLFLPGLGARNGCAIRIGNLLGEGRADKIRPALLVALGLSFLQVLAMAAVMGFKATAIVSVFTRDPAVALTTVSAWDSMLAVQWPYHFAFVAFGALSSVGRQDEVLTVFLASFAFGLAYGAYAGVVLHQGLTALWVGNALAFAISSFMLLRRTLLVDWNSAAQQHAKTERLLENAVNAAPGGA